MNRNGVLASMCFPSMAGFSGRTFQEAKDKDLSLVMLKAYNDWHIDEWCAAYPGRFIPLSILPLWDMDAVVEELKRVAAKGVRAVTHARVAPPAGLSHLPVRLVGSVLHRRCATSTWSCACTSARASMPSTCRTSISTNSWSCPPRSRSSPSRTCCGDRPSASSPGSRSAFSEGGIGWIPFLLDRVDRHYENQRWTGQDFGSKLPSEVFREHSLACFIADPTSLKLHQEIGEDIIAFETDYPHSDSLWPDAPEALLAQCEGAGCSDELIDKISWQNASRFCGWDAFAVIPRHEATVGALRAQSPGRRHVDRVPGGVAGPL